LIKHLFAEVKGIEFNEPFPRMTYDEAIHMYGSDKPDLRFGMKFNYLNALQGKGFAIFDQAETVLGIVVEGASEYTRKQLDELTEWVKRPQIGAKGMVYVKYNSDGSIKSSVDKFYTESDFQSLAQTHNIKAGDLLLILSGELAKTQKQMNELRLHVAQQEGLRNTGAFCPVWVLDFPLLEKDEASGRYFAMHHPFTSPKVEDIALMDSDPGAIRANAYDLAMNGVELGGGSIRIHDRGLQEKMFSLLGFTPEQAQEQFGFLMGAFEYGAPPHGGLAFGLDRLVATMSGEESIRDFIAFPKNNSGRDTMIDAPSLLEPAQLTELGINILPNGH
jgi:aspartyl-tRNA synthetase